MGPGLMGFLDLWPNYELGSWNSVGAFLVLCPMLMLGQNTQ